MKEIKNISLGINRLLLQSADTWQYRLTWIIADDKKLWIKKDSFMVGRSYISRKLKNQFRRASDLWGLVITSQVTKHRKNKINTPAFLWRKPFYVGSGNRRVQVKSINVKTFDVRSTAKQGRAFYENFSCSDWLIFWEVL